MSTVRSQPGLVRRMVKAALQTNREGARYHHALGDLVSGVRAKSLLDVGCRDGASTVELGRTLGVPEGQIYGIEIHPPFISEARQRLRVLEVDLESQRWPLADQSVDLITANQVFEHLKNVYFCLAECERVLTVGGHLAVGIPNLSSLLNRVYLLCGRQPMCLEVPGPHVRAFTHRAFLSLARMNPAFRVVRSRGSSLYPLPWPLVEGAARILPSLSAYTFYLLQKVEHRTSSVWVESVATIGATPFTHR